ncbi:unnamed protein product [Ophioblennius macclurei]
MTAVRMDVAKYLSRIGFGPWSECTLETLQSVQRRHLLSVPFENLTVHSGGRIHLDLPLLFDKIVNQRRGGFCCENNGLFSWLLTSLGFQVTLLSGQVRGITGHYGPPLDHLVIMVVLEGRRWLCDVGFGSAGFPTPLSLDTADPQARDHRMYRIREDAGMHYVEWLSDEMKSNEDKDWDALFKFTFEPRRIEDFIEMSLYHQSSPHSIFFSKSFCTMLKPGGRATYIGRKLIIKTYPEDAAGEVVTETRELQEEEIPHILEEIFGIVLLSPLIPKDEDVTPPPVEY